MDKIKWSYEKRSISTLSENPSNPRQISKQNARELKKSLSQFGLCQPIVIQPHGKVIGGHQRLRLLIEQGIEEVEVAVPSRALSQDEENELTIRLNKNTGEWDFDILANWWDTSDLIDWGFSLEDFDIKDEEDEEKAKPKSFKITIQFDNEDDLRHIEKELKTIMSLFPTATMKAKVK